MFWINRIEKWRRREVEEAMKASQVRMKDVAITWIYDAPVDRVWNAWTDVNMLKEFWGPSRCRFIEFKLDFRIGGKYLYCTEFPDGRRVWVTGTYRRIVPDKELVYTDSFSDAKGNIVPATEIGFGFGSEIPLERVVSINFEPFQDGTRIRLLMTGFPEDHSDIASTEMCKSFARLGAIIEGSD